MAGSKEGTYSEVLIRKENKNLDITLKKVTQKELLDLQKISIETFTETFLDDNNAESLKIYLEKAYNFKKLSSEVANTESNFQFIYYGKQLAGYIKLNVGVAQSEMVGLNTLEVERIYIKSSYKRLGLGKCLLNYAFKQAQELNKSKVWLGVWEQNINALNFYRKMGFVYFGKHIFDLGGEKQCDLLMEITINN
ncbi:GNAT family N-acetyltransferase [Lactovum miscens]|uniref:Ribosomal protein S18 acetylase RimI-like enzyme n=1 Tax=Lactovum miscens TaxID=190387 RepID=A0A841C9S7_9LACT|nr:GNAT family N-acetyltransferase [Lactovum miscens]MBB5888321.1 ribosomal protein S18 acetylase RimI-like enzyme [Lactovum miscens]